MLKDKLSYYVLVDDLFFKFIFEDDIHVDMSNLQSALLSKGKRWICLWFFLKNKTSPRREI